MGEGKPSLRWSVEQKLQFIEFRLFWEGHVNRADLMDTFGVSLNQASGDLNRYIDQTTPWILGKTEEGRERLKTVLYTLAECVRGSQSDQSSRNGPTLGAGAGRIRDETGSLISSPRRRMLLNPC